jgi:hypothetical protein
MRLEAEVSNGGREHDVSEERVACVRAAISDRASVRTWPGVVCTLAAWSTSQPRGSCDGSPPTMFAPLCGGWSPTVTNSPGRRLGRATGPHCLSTRAAQRCALVWNARSGTSRSRPCQGVRRSITTSWSPPNVARITGTASLTSAPTRRYGRGNCPRACGRRRHTGVPGDRSINDHVPSRRPCPLRVRLRGRARATSSRYAATSASRPSGTRGRSAEWSRSTWHVRGAAQARRTVRARPAIETAIHLGKTVIGEQRRD